MCRLLENDKEFVSPDQRIAHDASLQAHIDILIDLVRLLAIINNPQRQTQLANITNDFPPITPLPMGLATNSIDVIHIDSDVEDSTSESENDDFTFLSTPGVILDIE